MRFSQIVHFVLVFTLCLSLPREALAISGIAVRLSAVETELVEPLVVQFASDGQDTVSVALKDDGQVPDVFEGDNLYTGSGMLADGPFTVTVSASNKSWQGGEVSWTTTDGPRDLDLTLKDNVLTARTSQSEAPLPGPDGQVPTAVAQGGESPVGGAPIGNAAGPGTTRHWSESPDGPQSGSSSTETDESSYLFIGAGFLILAALGVFWLRGGPLEDEDDIRGLRVLPPPGLWGEGSPSALDGMACWQIAKADREAFIEATVRRLSPHYRLLIIGDVAESLPAVHGGPVYQGTAKNALQAGDLAEDVLALSPTRLVVVLVKGPNTTEHATDYRDMLPKNLCCIALNSDEVEGFTNMQVVRNGDDWTITPVQASETPA